MPGTAAPIRKTKTGMTTRRTTRLLPNVGEITRSTPLLDSSWRECLFHIDRQGNQQNYRQRSATRNATRILLLANVLIEPVRQDLQVLRHLRRGPAVPFARPNLQFVRHLQLLQLLHYALRLLN